MSSFASSISKVFYGTFIHSVSIKEIEFISNGLLFVDTHGRIAKIVRNVPNDQFRGALNGVAESKVQFGFLTPRGTLLNIVFTNMPPGVVKVVILRYHSSSK